MNNLPFPWWDKTITIYNKYVDTSNQRTYWVKTVVENCFWKADNLLFTMGGAGNSKVGVITETKKIICRIPKNDKYLNKRDWRELADKSGHFTLANEDIIVLGEVTDEIDEYTAGKRSTDLLSKYREDDSCLQIETYVDNCRTGIDLEHYKVIGK